MNLLDIILILPLILFAYNGYQKGFIIELSSLVALILGIYLAINFSDYAADFLVNNFNVGEQYLMIFAFILTFTIVVIGVIFIGKVLEKLINLVLLGFLNKIAGFVFGIIKAAFLISVVLWIINSFDENHTVIKDKNREESLLYEPLERLAPTIIPKFKLDKLQDIDLNIPDPKELLKKV